MSASTLCDVVLTFTVFHWQIIGEGLTWTVNLDFPWVRGQKSKKRGVQIQTDCLKQFGKCLCCVTAPVHAFEKTI